MSLSAIVNRHRKGYTFYISRGGVTTRIFGLQKLTLIDYPGKIACTVFTGGCNFRCPFCHNSGLVTHLDVSQSEEQDSILEFLKKRRSVLDGVCVSGGEPLMQPDIGQFLARLKDMGYSVKLDTNGSYPERLASAINGGLVDYVAMDIKNSPDKYPVTAGAADLDIAPVLKSAALLTEGRVDFEFRTTVVKELHDAADFEIIGKWLAGPEKFFLQSYKDAPSVIQSGYTAYSPEEMLALCNVLSQYIPNAKLREL